MGSVAVMEAGTVIAPPALTMVDGFQDVDPQESGVSTETNLPSPGNAGSTGAGGDDDVAAASGGRSPKRSRRSVQKRVVSIPIGEGDGSRSKGGGGGGAGDGAPPPADSWAWRKYGQKPIKGSPYPRGYYRCSSSKGCPARKQVERSRLDPTMLLVTYSFEHNHPWPLPKNNNHHHHNRDSSSAAATATNAADSKPAQLEIEHPEPPLLRSSSDTSGDTDHKFADLVCEDLIPGSQFPWFSDVGSPSSSTSPPAAADCPLLYGPIYGGAAMLYQDECDKLGDGYGEGDKEEDSLFAGLGELPECAMVFRRGFLERQMLADAQGEAGVSAAAL